MKNKQKEGTLERYNGFVKKRYDPSYEFDEIYEVSPEELEKIQQDMNESLKSEGLPEGFDMTKVSLWYAEWDWTDKNNEEHHVNEYFFVIPDEPDKIWVISRNRQDGSKFRDGKDDGQYNITTGEKVGTENDDDEWVEYGEDSDNDLKLSLNSDSGLALLDDDEGTDDTTGVGSNEDSSSEGQVGDSSSSTSTRNANDGDKIIIGSVDDTPPQQPNPLSVSVGKYADHTIGFDNWTVCADQDKVDNLKEGDVAAFGTKEADNSEENKNKNKSTKLTDMCKGEGIQSFNDDKVTIPTQVRSVIVGKLKESQTTFKFKAGQADTVKIVDSSKPKKVVVKIAVATLTLPPTVETTLDIQEGGSIKNLECDPQLVKLAVKNEEDKIECKTLENLMNEVKNNENKSITLANGEQITLTQENGTNKFLFKIGQQQGR